MNFEKCWQCGTISHDGRQFCIECLEPVVSYRLPDTTLQLVAVPTVSDSHKLSKKKRKK